MSVLRAQSFARALELAQCHLLLPSGRHSIANDASLEVTYNANPRVSFRRRDQGLSESLHSFKPELSMLTD